MRIWALLGLILALDGCSPPRAAIRAKSQGSDLVFTATVPSPLPFMRRTVSLQPDLVRVDQRGQVVWRIERRRDRLCRNYDAGGPSPVFPLTYGKVPACFTEIVRPRPLATGMLYRVAAVGGSRDDNGLGYFRKGATVENVATEPGASAGWSEIEPTYNVAAEPADP